MSLFTPPTPAESQWLAFEKLVQTEYSAYFDGEGPIAGARAPGRLDIMGGVADYSGSIVLEMPIAEAAFAAWQWRSDRTIRVLSVGVESDGFRPDAVFSLDDLVEEDGFIRPISEVSKRLTADPATRWAAYVVGCYHIMLTAYGKMSQNYADSRLGQLGANILLKSDVPLGAGVSSSAAIEVAVMHALSEAAGIQPSDMTLAAWCQRVENLIVGAPCGIMDQVTSALGHENSLVVLKCQPHTLLGTQRIPYGWRFLGIDSGVKHSVGGAHYTKARVGAFMGLKIIQLESGGKLLENYLCQMSPSDFLQYRELIPETLTGQEYIDLYGLLPDTITRVDPGETYHPRSCAEHPILENDRVKEMVAMMTLSEIQQDERLSETETVQLRQPPDDRLLVEAGQLMYDEHASYSDRLDLGAPETDLLVRFIKEAGADKGLYGARITGGGSGGTVAILCDSLADRSEKALEAIIERYERETGVIPRLFTGSSPGAVSFGSRHIIRG